MSLPDLIEIVPLTGPVRAQITVPGSKSITNRALVLAALADGEVTLTGALWSEDTQVMVECLQDLGFMVNVTPYPDEVCNRTITVYGQGGTIPGGGTAENPLELFVGNAGTAARFLTAMVCLGRGVYRLHGIPRMHERPQAALFAALRELGYRVEAEHGNDKLPVRIYGNDSRSTAGPRKCTVSIAQSSQFASALLLCAGHGGWDVKIEGENADESPYVVMTAKLIAAFPRRGGTFQIEPDASSGSYFWAAGSIGPTSPESLEFSEKFQMEVSTHTISRISVAHWPQSGWQIDERFDKQWYRGGAVHALLRSAKQGQTPDIKTARRIIEDSYRTPTTLSRKTDLGDSIMTAIVISPLIISGNDAFCFTDLGRLRVQECERVVALRTELTKCGAKVIETGDTLTVYPSELHGAEIETYNDHRMAMCFAILGLKVPGIKIKNPACVKKTFPNFFQKLAAPPPGGLGVTIRDGTTGRELKMDELFAE